MRVAHLEARVGQLETQNAQSRTAELTMREQLGRLKERLSVLKRELADSRGEQPAIVANAPGPRGEELLPGPALAGPSPEQLTTLWRTTGELLDRLHTGQSHSALPPLVQEYLDINIHSGLINERLRRHYYKRLRRIQAQAAKLDHSPKP